MTRHLPFLVAAAALAAVTSPAVGQSVPPPPPIVTGPGAAGAPFATQAGQGVYQDAPDPYPAAPYAPAAYPAAPYAQGGWVWHGEGGPAAGIAYSHGPYAQGNWVWEGEGGQAAGYGYVSGSSANPCGCPGAVTWVQVPVQTRYSYSPAIRHDKQVVDVHTVNDVVVENKTVSVPRTTKYVKTPATKVTKVTKTRATK